MAGRKRRKGLTEEDRAAWEKVARTARPLTPRAEPPSGVSPPSPPEPPARTTAQIRKFRLGEAAAEATPAHRISPPLEERLTQAPVRMHHGTHRKMIRGKLEPEARIDLHGMTLAHAHPALTRFILQAHDRGLRLVLVITGKGRAGDEGGPVPVRRGVLRQQVPGWLVAPPMGAHVLDIRPAHPRHGGLGAYYVYLRRSR